MTDNARIDERSLPERLRSVLSADDHERGCQGREYTCTCGYDDKILAITEEAAAYIEAADALARRSIQEQPEAVGKDQIPRKQQADAYLEALLGYSGGFYGAAIKAGLPAAETVGPVAHIERAARELHRLAVASSPPPIAEAGWKPRGVSDEVVKLVRDAFTDGMEWADKPWGPGYTAWDQSQSKVKLNAMISADSPLHTEASPVPDNTDARGAQVKSLEWTEISVDRGDGSRDLTGEIEAETVLGTYSVTIDTDEDVAAYPWCVWTPLDSLGHFASPDEGRAAAQADYASRILAAIVPGTEALDEGADQRKAVAWRVWNKTDPNAGWEFVLDPTWYCRPENAAHFAVDPLFVASIPREIEP